MFFIIELAPWLFDFDTDTNTTLKQISIARVVLFVGSNVVSSSCKPRSNDRVINTNRIFVRHIEHTCAINSPALFLLILKWSRSNILRVRLRTHNSWHVCVTNNTHSNYPRRLDWEQIWASDLLALIDRRGSYQVTRTKVDDRQFNSPNGWPCNGTVGR